MSELITSAILLFAMAFVNNAGLTFGIRLPENTSEKDLRLCGESLWDGELGDVMTSVDGTTSSFSVFDVVRGARLGDIDSWKISSRLRLQRGSIHSFMDCIQVPHCFGFGTKMAAEAGLIFWVDSRVTMSPPASSADLGLLIGGLVTTNEKLPNSLKPTEPGIHSSSPARKRTR